MKKFNCTASGNPAYTPRCWYDPWLLVAEMIFLTFSSVVFLIADIYYHFMGYRNINIIMIEFKEHMDLVYNTVPYYIEQIKKS